MSLQRLMKETDVELQVEELDNLAAYHAYRAAHAPEYEARDRYERDLCASGEPFEMPGYCYLCRRPVNFRVNYEYAILWNGLKTPNYREQVNCSVCGFNNRMRAAFQVFEQIVRPQAGRELYITEQITPMYTLLKQRFGRVVGSEYLGGSVPYGSIDVRGVRNESVTKLTFANDRFAAIVSFDVLEHVPDYTVAFRECLRCLAPGGTLLFTVPFTGLPVTITRARVEADGEIVHLLPPEYHGDPLTNEGCLCFYHFGWDMLDSLRSAGFASARALLYYSKELGYIGKGEQLIFAASKPH